MTVMVNESIYLNIGSNAQTADAAWRAAFGQKKSKFAQNCFLATGSRHNERIQM